MLTATLKYPAPTFDVEVAKRHITQTSVGSALEMARNSTNIEEQEIEILEALGTITFAGGGSVTYYLAKVAGEERAVNQVHFQ